jgi:O-methyltransferase
MDINQILSLIRPPVPVRHAEISMLFSADDEHSAPSEFLLNLSLEAAKHAYSISLDDISKRLPEPPYYPNIWPGEHYRLLAAIVEILQPKSIVEIGTFTGLSALSMKKFLPLNSNIYTFDIIPWKEIGSTCLTEDDFTNGQLVQHVDNLQRQEVIEKHKNILNSADIIFMDNFYQLSFTKQAILILDDIRLWNMLKIWREIKKPKLDVTSFGHWSGTGLVELT